MFQLPFPVLGLRGARQALTFGISVAPLFAGLALAQPAHDMAAIPPAKAAVAGAAKSVPPLQFESVLSRYKPMTDQKLGSWRDANDTVTRIGGWRTYLKESQEPDAPATTAPAATTTPSTTTRPATPSAPTAPNPHAGHGVKP